MSDAFAGAAPFYPVSLSLSGRRCVVIGAGDDREAIEKARDLREAGADVAWIADPAALHDDDVADAFLVISTPQDAALSMRLRALADRYRFLLCAIDQPEYNSVAMAAIVKAGPARVAISTGGVAPRVGGTLRAALQRALRRAVRRLSRRARAAPAHRARRSSRRWRGASCGGDRRRRRLRGRRARDVPGVVSRRTVRDMASVEIVTIGTEILLGHLIDTNSAFISRVLADNGVDVYAKHSVGDNAERLARMLEDVLERADGAITTGGLGPTVDDLTKDAVAHAVGDTLELHEPSLRAMEERFRYFNRPMSDNNRRQAILPSRAHVMPNPHGTAPGFIALRPPENSSPACRACRGR